MAKLYPPHLEGTLPAFYGGRITVPFTMNRAVGKDQVKGFSLLVKSIQTGKQIVALTTKDFDLNLGAVFYKVPDPKRYFTVGQSYKFQLAYMAEGDIVGYYSSVTIAKCTSKPEIKIEGLSSGLNKHKYNYIGEYKTQDITEKMYSCQFKVYDQLKNIIADTGEIIHNSLNDESPEGGWYKASETFDLIQELDSGKNYYIQFLVKTIGLMELDTGLYQIVQSEPIPMAPEKTIIIDPILNYDNGYIDISIRHYNSSPMTGKYVLSRASSKDNFKSWNEIMRFSINGETSKEIWKDFTIEHGVSYKYAIFMVDEKNRYSNKVESKIILADFEDMFLFDGDKQLKIRFNPSMSNFKNTILESKTDTIGGKYPYIFRNGHVKYKEFDIGGLISHLSDSDGYFETALAQIKQENNTLTYTGLYNTQLNTENIAMERDFKTKALEWLSNGKIKLFRSPTEGNFIVRLMNVSLSPVEGLGRMLHNFSGAATEIKEYTHKNLVDSGIIKDNLLVGLKPIITKTSHGQSLSVLSLSENYIEKLGISKAIGIKFYPDTTTPGAGTKVNINDSIVDITKSQYLTMPITILKAYDTTYGNGTFELYYEKEIIPEINNNINGVDSIDIPIIEFCGASDIYSAVNIKANLLERFLTKNKEYLSQLFSIKCERRSVIRTKIKNNNWNELYNYSQDLNNVTSADILREDVNTVYVVYNSDNSILGYKDHGKSLKLEDWSSLRNIINAERFIITFINNQEKKTQFEIPNNGFEFSEADIDFSNLTSITGSLWLKITFSCRLGSIDYKTSNIPESVIEAWELFQTGVYQNQSQLENILQTIQSWWKESKPL